MRSPNLLKGSGAWNLPFFPCFVYNFSSKQVKVWWKARSSFRKPLPLSPFPCTVPPTLALHIIWLREYGSFFGLQRKGFLQVYYPPPFTPLPYLKFYRLLKIILVGGLQISQEPQHSHLPPTSLGSAWECNAESGKSSGSQEIHVSIPLPSSQCKLAKLIWWSPEDYQTQAIWLHLS